MSYDFILLHREPGQSWDEVLEARERVVIAGADRPFDPAALPADVRQVWKPADHMTGGNARICRCADGWG
jgi:hypothetical protein